jgi:hypothetical protein
MRQRDSIRTARSGWAGNLLNPPLDRRGRRHGMIYSVATVVDDVERQGQSGFEEQAKTAAERRAEDERDEPKTVAELADYLAGRWPVEQRGAWDPGGPIYCATKTWYGSGLSDAFERLAAQLSPAERRAAEQNLRAALPPCRNCGCQTAPKLRPKKRNHQWKQRGVDTSGITGDINRAQR